MADDDNDFYIVPGVGGQSQQSEPSSGVGGGQPSQPGGDIGGAAGALGGAAAVLTLLRVGGQIGARELITLAGEIGTATIPVSSACIASVSYEIASGDMEITFVDGSVYYYPETTMYQFLQFINSRSKGSYYNKYLRGSQTPLIMGKKKGWKMPLG
jgi:hypothetical protein